MCQNQENSLTSSFLANVENQPYAMRQIKGAMEMWESTTCIRFVRRTNEFDYVYFYESDR